ncbi:DinB family protein [Algibacter pacificus]|uniref:DinB family protein n=1 Tax=Algibacter pacificus TaxID=2599389 RepID=UPI0011CCA1B9|nr:DinB family protein [Algibacter pacificus]
MKVIDLKPDEFHPYYASYIGKVPQTWELKSGFETGAQAMVEFFKSIPSEKLEYRYAEDKWTIKELLQHIIDTERVMMHRCFRIARRDITPLPGFEQNDYIMPSKANSKSIDTLIEEYQIVRKNSMVLLSSLSSEDLKCIGTASGGNMSARATAFITLGHEIWHADIIKLKYL